MTRAELVERLAALEHDRWARWYRYQRDHTDPDNTRRWDRLAETTYFCLDEPTKDSDRAEVEHGIALIEAYADAARQEEREACRKIVADNAILGEAGWAWCVKIALAIEKRGNENEVN